MAYRVFPEQNPTRLPRPAFGRREQALEARKTRRKKRIRTAGVAVMALGAAGLASYALGVF